MVNKRLSKAVASVAALVVMMIGLVVPASATNEGSINGAISTQCGINGIQWQAETKLAKNADDLPDELRHYNAQGNYEYSHSGYVSQVSLESENAVGQFELQHFFIGSGANATQAWRIPVAVKGESITGATVTFTPPSNLPEGAEVAANWAMSSNPDFDFNGYVQRWGGVWEDFEWQRLSESAYTKNDDGTWTVNVGDVARGDGVFFQFDITVPAGTDPAWTEQLYTASAEFTATYVERDDPEAVCPATMPDYPKPTPSLGQCQVEYLGVTRYVLGKGDVTDRIKIYEGEISDLTGEVNSDSWGWGWPNSDAWGFGRTGTYRNYIATTQPLENVVWTVEAIQGMTWRVPEGSVAWNSPGGGQLQNNGYTNAVSGAEITYLNDESIRIDIESMRDWSSMSFNSTGVLDGSGKSMVLHHRAIGDIPGCEPSEPEVVESEWTITKKNCEDGTVTEERTITTTPYVWQPGSYVKPGTEGENVPGQMVPDPDNATVETETRVRAMTDAELKECTPQPTTDPTEEPTTEPTTEPTEGPTTEPTEEPTTPADPTTEPTEDPTTDKPVKPSPSDPGAPVKPGKPAPELPNTGSTAAVVGGMGILALLAGLVTLAVRRRIA